MNRVLRSLLVITASVFAITVATVLLFVWRNPSVSADEVARTQSPQGDLEAVLVETNGGATTSFGYEVFVVPRGTQPTSGRAAYLYGAVRNSNAYGANLRWAAPAELQVEFERANSTKLEQPSITVSGQTVNVRLVPGITDQTAPPGGMHYNQNGRK